MADDTNLLTKVNLNGTELVIADTDIRQQVEKGKASIDEALGAVSNRLMALENESSGITATADSYVTNIKLNSDTIVKIKDQETSNNLASHVGNTSNPHHVTKAQIGLEHVADYDQSKAIVSITGNGTTFTATALDGTTTTFTVQGGDGGGDGGGGGDTSYSAITNAQIDSICV